MKMRNQVALAAALLLGLTLPAHQTQAMRAMDNSMVSCAVNPCATRVYGQPDFTTNAPNAVTAGSMNLPQSEALDASGLYVVDHGDSRVLHFPAGSTIADRVYGQPGFTSYSANGGGVSATSLSFPQGVAVDGSGGLYIADTGNRRVLHYPSGSTTADRVYGQPNFTTNARPSPIGATSLFWPDAVAADGSGGLYAADQSLNRVLHFPSGSTTADIDYGQPDFTSFHANNGTSSPSATSLAAPEGVALDGSGTLYIADSGNNRVLHYPLGSTTADRVYGQGGSFTSSTANNGGVSAASLNIATGNPTGIALDGNGNLYVADISNNRVLYYPAGSTTATQVYGQTGFTSSSGGATATGLASPYGVALDGSGNLYVGDGGNNRALFYAAGSPAGSPASTTANKVYGQADFSSSNPGQVGPTTLLGNIATVTGTALDGSGGFYLADTANNRVLHYPAGSTTADRVYGQGGSFASSTANNGGISATSLDAPTGIALDGSGGLYVADAYNNRVLHYPAGSTTADRVYGQQDFSSNGHSSSVASATSLWQPDGLAVDSSGLYVADAQNDRVLHYSGNSTTADSV